MMRSSSRSTSSTSDRRRRRCSARSRVRLVRGKGPSMPGVAAMALRLSSVVRVSIMAKVTMSVVGLAQVTFWSAMLASVVAWCGPSCACRSAEIPRRAHRRAHPPGVDHRSDDALGAEIERPARRSANSPTGIRTIGAAPPRRTWAIVAASSEAVSEVRAGRRAATRGKAFAADELGDDRIEQAGTEPVVDEFQLRAAAGKGESAAPTT